MLIDGSVDASARDHLALIEVANDALVGLTNEGVVQTWNPAAARLFGYDASEVIGHPVSLLAEPSQFDEQEQIIQSARAGNVTGPIVTTRRRRDGTEIAVEVTVVPVRDERGRVLSLASALRDISEWKKADLQRELVTDELTHRLKNTLAMVQSIAMQTLRDATSIDTFAVAFDARLAALSRTSELLTQIARQPVTLSDLVATALTPHGATTDWRASGPPTLLSAAQVLPMGMILHELATNAAKYGAFSTPTGQVHVSWSVDKIAGMQHLILSWIERGGPVVRQPTRKGFGSRLMANCVAGELGGNIAAAYEPTGFTCRVDIPLSATGGIHASR